MSKPRRPPGPAQVPYSDIELDRWQDYDDIWTDSLWDIPSRARGDGHALEYHGNFVPQIATQSFLRFTRQGEVVVDLFLGSGTSAVEALRLGRRCIGVELRPELAERLTERFAHAPEQIRVICGDSAAPETREAIRGALTGWEAEAADLVMLHPPYGDIIRFSDSPACLSNAATTAEFLDRFREVAATGWHLLRPGRFAVLVIGDAYRNGELVPLGFECMRVMRELGFRARSIVVKNIVGNEVGKGRTNNLWRYRALRSGFYVFKHEYVMFFDRPQRRGGKRKPNAGAALP